MRALACHVVSAAVTALAGCGGLVAPVVDDLPFAPQQRSAGYGFTGGMHVSLVDPSSDHVSRTLRIAAKDLSGTFSVSGGTATVSLVEVRPAGYEVTYVPVSGVVSIEGAPSASERVDVDLLFADPKEPWRQHRLAGSFLASLDYEG